MPDDTETGFVIDQIDEDTWTWSLLGPNEEVLARCGKGFATKEDAQVAIVSVKIAAREHEVPADPVKNKEEGNE